MPPETALTRKTQAELLAEVPDWMKGTKAEGQEKLKEHQSQPRLKIVQGSSKPETKMIAPEGSVLVQPGGALAARAGQQGQPGEPIVVVPFFFFPTWEKWADANDSTQPMVVEQSFDKTSPLAAKCRDRTQRKVPYPAPNPNNLNYRHVECLNFMVEITTGPAAGMVATLTFAAGEHGTGANLNRLLNERPCAMYGNRLELRTKLRTRNNKSWYGFEVSNPADGAFIKDQAEFKRYEELNKGFAQLQQAGRLVVGRDDEDRSTEHEVVSDQGGADLPNL